MASTADLPLLARIEGTPKVDRGAAGGPVIRFRIILSDAPHEGFSYKTLRFGGISVWGGKLEKTQRTVKLQARAEADDDDDDDDEAELRDNPDWNRDWTVTVRLAGDRTEVSFPANYVTRRSIYTEDGRVLANQITITIPDPDGRGDSRTQDWLQ